MNVSSEFDYSTWDVTEYSTATPLKEYIKVLKEQLIGDTILSIHSMGAIFNNYDNELLDEWEPEYGGLDLDEPVVIKTDHNQLEVWFYTDSRAKIGMNTMTMQEESYQGYPWRDCSVIFKHCIGQMIEDVVVKTGNGGFYDSLGLGDRPIGGDYFREINLILANGYGIRLIGQCEYMWVAEAELVSKHIFPTDARIYNAESAKAAKQTTFLQFVPSVAGLNQYLDALWILEDDCSILGCAITKVLHNFDIYGDYEVDGDTWQKILGEWQFFCYAQNFDDVFEAWSEIDMATHSIGDNVMSYLLNHQGKHIWQRQQSEKHLYMNVAEWSERVFRTCTHINITGL